MAGKRLLRMGMVILRMRPGDAGSHSGVSWSHSDRHKKRQVELFIRWVVTT